MEHKILKRHPIGNKRFKWKQKDYIISTFSGYPESNTEIGDKKIVADRYAKYHKEAGFNLLELGWVAHEGAWAAAEAAENNGIDLLFQDLSLFGGMDSKNLDKEITRENIYAVVDKLKDKKHVIGYYVWDEPHTDDQLKEARRQMDIFEEAAPEALLFTVAVPDYNFIDGKVGSSWENGKYEPYINKFAKVMSPPVMSFDYYPVGNYFDAWPGHTYSYENQLDDSFMYLSMALVRDVAKKNDLPFWFYYQGYHLYKKTHKSEDFVFPMVRLFMYSAVLYGAKGLQNYATGEIGNRFMNPDGTKGDFYEDQKKINFEIKALGNTLMALDSKLIIHSCDLLPDCIYKEPYFNQISDSKIFNCILPKRTSIGELSDEYGNRYAVILNRDYEKELSCTLGLSSDFRIYEVSKTDGKQRIIEDSTDALNINLAPGDAVLYRIQDAKDEAFTIEYVLE